MTDITGTEGETLKVDATITNHDGSSDEQTITLEIKNGSSEVVDSKTLSIDGSSEKPETWRWETESGDAGNYTATIYTDDDSDEITVEVTEGALEGELIDDFEHDDINGNYQTESQTSPDDNYSIVSTPTYSGSFALAKDSGASDEIYSEPGDGLPGYPKRGSVMWGWIRIEDSDDRPKVGLLAASGTISGSAYGAQMDLDADSQQLILNDSDDHFEFSSESVSIDQPSVNTWLLFRYKIDYNDSGEFEATVWDGPSTSDTELGTVTVTVDESNLSDTYNENDEYGLYFRSQDTDSFYDHIHRTDSDSSPDDPNA